jgi:hypothetical protein
VASTCSFFSAATRSKRARAARSIRVSNSLTVFSASSREVSLKRASMGRDMLSAYWKA